MKNTLKILSLLTMVLLFTYCNNEKPQNVVNCQIDGLQNGDKVILLIGTRTDDLKKVDSLVYNGQQSFELKTDAKDVSANIAIVPKGDQFNIRRNENIYFFLEGYSVLQFKAKAKELGNADITGGLYDLPELIQRKKIIAQYKEMQEKSTALYKQANKNNDNKELADSLRRIAKNASNEAYKFYSSNVDSLNKEFVKTHPNIAYSAELLHYDYELKWKDSIYEFEQAYLQLSERVRNTPIGKTVSNYIAANKATGVGGIAPNFTIKDIEGNDISLDSFKGKYVLFEFWGTWCGGCVAAMPHLKALREEIPAEQLVMFSIACNEKSEKYWRNYVTKEQANWHQALAKNKSAQKMYAVQGYPSFFFINPEGKILAKGFQIEKIITKIKEELQKQEN